MVTRGDGPRQDGRTSARLSLCVFVVLVLLLLPVRVFDRDLFLALNGRHSPWTDHVWLGLTTAGDGFLLGIFLGAFAAVNPRVTVFGLGLLLASSAVMHLIKAAIPTLRPVSLLDGVHVVGPLLRSGSFPSGHSASAIAAALAVACYSPGRPLKVAAMAFGCMIATSRVFVGAHFPGDVIGGSAIAVGLFSLAAHRHLFCDSIPATPTRGSRWFTLAVTVELTACLVGLVWYSFNRAESPLVSAGICSAVMLFVLLRVLTPRERSHGL